MSKPRVDPTFGISSVDVLILTERHPACRWREAQPGSCKERENLAGDAKGKGTSGTNREAESTDAPERGVGLSEPVSVTNVSTCGANREAKSSFTKVAFAYPGWPKPPTIGGTPPARSDQSELASFPASQPRSRHPP